MTTSPVSPYVLLVQTAQRRLDSSRLNLEEQLRNLEHAEQRLAAAKVAEQGARHLVEAWQTNLDAVKVMNFVPRIVMGSDGATPTSIEKFLVTDDGGTTYDAGPLHERPSAIDCTGLADCPARIHVHGCYTDLGACTDPLEHHGPDVVRQPVRVHATEERDPINFLHVVPSQRQRALDHLAMEEGLGERDGILPCSLSPGSWEGRRYMTGDRIFLVGVPDDSSLRDVIRRNLQKCGLWWEDIVTEFEVGR